MFGEADLEFVTLDQSQIQVLSGLQCSEEDRPKLQAEITLPGFFRKHVED